MILIKDLKRLQEIENLRLIAGDSGMERAVTAAVLFEYDPSRMQLPDFYRGDLVVTTLAYARGDIELVDQSLLALIRQGIAGLLVKTAYFSHLSDRVVEMANNSGTPIFLFDNTYIEEVILQVTDLIRGKSRFSGYDKDISELMQGNLGQMQIRERISRIDPAGFDHYCAIAFYSQGWLRDFEDMICQAIDRNILLEKQYVFMEYSRMILILCRIQNPFEENEFAVLNQLLTEVPLKKENIFIGVSEIYHDEYEIGNAMKEAIICAKTAQIKGVQTINTKMLGIYAYLFPMAENAFICRRCQELLNQIRRYDKLNHTTLEHTAKEYITQGMDIPRTAKVLFQHANTIRYRLRKIQELMNLEDDKTFEAMLNLTINLGKVIEKEHPFI